MNALDYLLKANLYGLLFVGCYYLLLQRHTFFALNRAYLLTSAVLSLTLPLVTLPAETVDTPFVPTGIIILPVVAVDAISVADSPDWEMIGLLAYGLITFVLIGLLAWRLARVLQLIRQSPRQVCRDYVLVQPGNPAVPTFSFFRHLVINPADRHNDIIIRHELVHIRQWHSADVLGLALLRAVFWACPALRLIDRALRQVHEFLADRTATQPTDYARFLVDYAFGLQPDRLTNGFFNPSLLKQRILMLHQRATTRWALSKYVVVLPLAFGLLAMTTAREKITTVVGQVTNETITVSGRVTDQYRKPLAGANVVIANTKKGTSTDANGKFTLTDVPKNALLAVSFTGFRTNPIPVESQSIINVVLQPMPADELPTMGATAAYKGIKPNPAMPVRTPPSSETINGEVYTAVEEPPVFATGIPGLMQYVAHSLRYPAKAIANRVEGTVFVNFTVLPTGLVGNVTVRKGIGSGCDEEAVRIVREMPKWIPGQQNGKPTGMRYILPVQFALEKATQQPSPTAQPDSGRKQGFNAVSNQDPNSRFALHNDVKTYGGSTNRYAMPFPDSLRSSSSGSLGPKTLFVIDSVMSTRDDLKKLNKNKIDHITVLKDAQAIAMFGEKGKNGVIIITTKKTMTTLPYLLTTSLYLVLFYGLYWLILRQNTFFGLNRAYLLVSVCLAILLPFIELPGNWVVGTMSAMQTITLPTFVVGTKAVAHHQGLTPDQWFELIYGLGVASMLVRLGLNVRAVFRLMALGEKQRKRDYTLVLLPDTLGTHGQTTPCLIPSFSFMRYLVLNSADAQARPEAIIRHEAAHIRQRHTADILLIELVMAVFWFNPVLWLYKRAFQEVHEFLADRSASRPSAATTHLLQPDYARQLVAYALNVSPTALTTPFASVSTLKQRIVMLQKPQSNRRALLGYALVLPIAGLMLFCTQSEHDTPQSEQVAAQSARPAQSEHPAALVFPNRVAGVDGEIFTVVEHQPEFPGGMAALGTYLSQQIKYPAAAQKANINGRVFVNFVVTKTGEITDVNILKDVGFGTGEEAVRVTKGMPRWIPGRQSGQVVNVRFNLPINFELE